MDMDSLPESLLLEILSRLDDSSDVARCRVASKAFDDVFPGLRSINLLCSRKWYRPYSSSCSRSSSQPSKAVFVDLISKLNIVESVSIGNENPNDPFVFTVCPENDDLYFMDSDFVKQWLPRVSESLKSLSISDHHCQGFLDDYFEFSPKYHNIRCQSNVLPLVSAYCHNLVTLNLKFAWLSMDNLNPMPMLTSLTLESTRLEDENLDELNKCFPNLQVLNLVDVSGLKDPKIHLLNLKACHWDARINHSSALTLITPNLITLKFECFLPKAIHVEAPMLTHFDLSIDAFKPLGTFPFTQFENLKTLLLDSPYIDESLLLEFFISERVENLTLESRGVAQSNNGDSKLSLETVFVEFPNLSSLRVNQAVWADFEACFDQCGWEFFYEREGLKTICAYLLLVDPMLTFSFVACVLDQCVGLSEVSLLIHGDVVGSVSKSFMSKCMARWPGLKWRWGVWSEDNEDSWITDGIDN